MDHVTYELRHLTYSANEDASASMGERGRERERRKRGENGEREERKERRKRVREREREKFHDFTLTLKQVGDMRHITYE